MILESLLNICMHQHAFLKREFLDICIYFFFVFSRGLERWFYSNKFYFRQRNVCLRISYLYVIHKMARSIHKTRLPRSSTVSVGESATGCLFASVNFIPLKWKLERKGKKRTSLFPFSSLVDLQTLV